MINQPESSIKLISTESKSQELNFKTEKSVSSSSEEDLDQELLDWKMLQEKQQMKLVKTKKKVRNSVDSQLSGNLNAKKHLDLILANLDPESRKFLKDPTLFQTTLSDLEKSLELESKFQQEKPNKQTSNERILKAEELETNFSTKKIFHQFNKLCSKNRKTGPVSRKANCRNLFWVTIN